mgnify:CR=1 FL=1
MATISQNITRLVNYARKAECDYAVDVFYRYGTDGNAAVRAGAEIMKVYRNSDNYNIEVKRDNTPLTIADRLAHNKIKEVLMYVHTHYSEKLTVENASSLINYSPNYFSKLFHELTGTSFIQYVINYRLDIASEKLINTKLTITEIAEETGFSNLPYFTRSFTAKYGSTPNAYRKLKNSKTKFLLLSD